VSALFDLGHAVVAGSMCSRFKRAGAAVEEVLCCVAEAGGELLEGAGETGESFAADRAFGVAVGWVTEFCAFFEEGGCGAVGHVG
jgi:hypothetical protein